jgi:hypothetical protein
VDFFTGADVQLNLSSQQAHHGAISKPSVWNETERAATLGISGPKQGYGSGRTKQA